MEKNIKAEQDRLKKEREDQRKERESRRNDRKVEQEKSRQERENWRNDRKAEQEKYYETIKQEREAFNKKISLLEQQKKDLEVALKNAKAESNQSTEKKSNVVKFTPNVEKKEVNAEGKTAPIIKIEPKVDGVVDDYEVEVKKPA